MNKYGDNLSVQEASSKKMKFDDLMAFKVACICPNKKICYNHQHLYITVRRKKK